MSIRGLAILFLFSVGACVPVGPAGPGAGTGLPRPGGGTPISNIANGAGAPDPGFAGYIITASAGIFRITWAGYHEFRGSVFATNNDLGRFYAGCMDSACSLASSEDAVVLGNGDPARVDFVSFPASGKRSGFDVEVRSSDLLIDLLINDQRNPAAVTFVSADTGQPATAATLPLRLVVR